MLQSGFNSICHFPVIHLLYHTVTQFRHRFQISWSFTVIFYHSVNSINDNDRLRQVFSCLWLKQNWFYSDIFYRNNPFLVRTVRKYQKRFYYNPGQNIWNKTKKMSKTAEHKKSLIYLLLSVSWLLLSKFNLWKKEWLLACVSIQHCDFSNFS